MVPRILGRLVQLTVTAADFERRFAGRMETGRDSVSDPAMGMMVGTDDLEARPMPSPLPAGEASEPITTRV